MTSEIMNNATIPPPARNSILPPPYCFCTSTVLEVSEKANIQNLRINSPPKVIHRIISLASSRDRHPKSRDRPYEDLVGDCKAMRRLLVAISARDRLRSFWQRRWSVLPCAYAHFHDLP